MARESSRAGALFNILTDKVESPGSPVRILTNAGNDHLGL